ncbi:hypothetical protein ATCC90586_007732 [Pythium insidiosum]|nr:hypothetical protein ATCC90586_007732 [Pythium insidiosum]
MVAPRLSSLADSRVAVVAVAGDPRIRTQEGSLLTSQAPLPRRLSMAARAGGAELVARTASVIVSLQPVAFRSIRLAVIALHVLCGGFCLAAGLMYAYLPSTALAWFLKIYALTVDPRHFHNLAIPHYLLAILHFYHALEPPSRWLWHRLRALLRREPLHSVVVQPAPRQRGGSTVSSTIASVPRLQQPPPTALRLAVISLRRGLRRLRRGVRRLVRVCSPESPYFNVLYLARELLEIALQTSQAYQMSCLVPRVTLNRFIVTLLVLNCWLTTGLYHVGRGRPELRLWCLASDVALDFVSAVLVPAYLALQYVLAFDTSTTMFPDARWYDDVWFMNFKNESSIVLFDSWLDVFSRFFFSLSLLASLRAIPRLVRSSASLPSLPAREPSLPARPPKRSLVRADAARPLNSLFVETLADSGRRNQRVIRAGHRLIAMLGTLVLIAHVTAEARPTPVACVLEVRPWFVWRPACSLVQISCRNGLQTANASTLSTIFSSLDDSTIAYLVIRHCPNVSMPPDLQRMPSLIGIKLYNSSIDEWSSDAALEKRYHPNMFFLLCVRTRFPTGELPDGLLSSSFPPLLRDIELVITNLRSLPESLHTRWPSGLLLLLEEGKFDHVPPTLFRLGVAQLSLNGNADISSLPVQLLTHPELLWLGLRGTAVAEFPAALMNNSWVHLDSIFLDKSNLSTLPAWMDDSFMRRVRVTAAGTPLCRSFSSSMHERDALQLDGSAGLMGVVDPRLALLDCELPANLLVYPIALEETFP